MQLVCSQRDSILARYGTQLAAIGTKAPIAMRDALNREWRKGRKEVRQALVRQTRLRAGVIRRAVDPNTRFATAGNLTAKMLTRGGEVSLKYYGPRETRSGAVHRSPKAPRPVPGGFIKGGKFPGGRKAIRPPVSTGHVWIRRDPGKWPLSKVGSGVWIPKEMVEGESRDRYRAVPIRLDETLAKQIARYLPG